MTAALQGVRVLVVEDEFLIAMLLQEMLESAGCVISGPIPRLAEALDAADGATYDAAVFDVNLAGERVDPVAHALARRHIPSPDTAPTHCRPTTPIGRASVSPLKWQNSSTRYRALSRLPACRRELGRRPPPPNRPRRNSTEPSKSKRRRCC